LGKSPVNSTRICPHEELRTRLKPKRELGPLLKLRDMP
jgi:hypothetical protein